VKSEEVEMLRFPALSIAVNTSLPTKILSTIIRPQQGTLRRIFLLGHGDAFGTTSYTVKVVNATDAVVLGELEVVNITPEESIVDVGIVQEEVIDHNYILEITLQRNNGSSTIYINEIIFYKEG
jgi:hypothetical protein